MARRYLSALSSAERAQLADLILEYATPAIVAQHANAMNVHHGDPARFLSWHRQYIRGLEKFLTRRGHSKFVPLPKWSPATCIPAEFDLPTGFGALQNLCPNISFSPMFNRKNLSKYKSAAALGRAIEPPHDRVHTEIGGVMANLSVAPSAPIFWAWHAYIDDIFARWRALHSKSKRKSTKNKRTTP